LLVDKTELHIKVFVMDLTPDINAAVLKRDQGCCIACGFAVGFALAIHHAVPRSLGGGDAKANLKTLCANCHRLVHCLSVGRRLEGRAGREIKRAIKPRAFEMISKLARLIRLHRRRILLAGNRWVQHGDVARGPTSLADALQVIEVRNGFEVYEAALMRRVVHRVLQSIPADIRRQCSFRIVNRGLYLSVNAGNHLVFRTPSYSDNGRRQDADLWLIWPQSIPISVLSKSEWKWASGVRFSAIPCFNVELSFDQALALRPHEWRIFANACRDALTVRRTRRWVSNVRLPRIGVA
jgi:hypothetical protein